MTEEIKKLVSLTFSTSRSR